jgi:hypothetical protein
VITGPSDIRHTPLTRDWSLGAVLAQREIDEHTCVLVIRADVGWRHRPAVRRVLEGAGLEVAEDLEDR